VNGDDDDDDDGDDGDDDDGSLGVVVVVVVENSRVVVIRCGGRIGCMLRRRIVAMDSEGSDTSDAPALVRRAWALVVGSVPLCRGATAANGAEN
jgi:hypothetical protein